MRVLLRVLVLVGFGLATVAAASCSLDVEGALDDSDAGTGGAGGSVECWSGQKWCNGKCYDYDDPKAGCGSSSCEPCNVPFANTTCINNACAVESCQTNYADCDKNEFAPGCEVDTLNNKFNCGGCVAAAEGSDCSLLGNNWICENGTCVVTDCVPQTTGNCDGDKSNGCETDLESDINHCGFCNNACVFPHSTAQCVKEPTKIGDCMIIACEPGYENCNGVILDGCETNVLSDTGNCGSCGNVCSAPANGIPICVGGGCDFTCSAPYTKCGSACVDTSIDVGNCGTCGKVCTPPAGGFAGCVNGACVFDCTAPLTKCGTQCVDTKTNVGHCGGCNSACSAPTNGSVSCDNGTCVKSCPNGLTICNNICVNLQSSNAHCGGCNSPCSNERVCQNGSCGCPGTQPIGCSTTCEPECCPGAGCSPPSGGVCQSNGYCGCSGGLTACGGTCVNTSTSSTNCGACNVTCVNQHGTTQCNSGTCQPSCSGGWASCDNNPVNGCEADLQNGVNTCGNCGTQCVNPNGTTSCSGGTCQPNCSSGYGDCDSNKANGCETNENTSEQHCGGCGSPCGSGQTCESGICTCPTGTPKFCDGACRVCCVKADCGGGDNCCSYACKSGPC